MDAVALVNALLAVGGPLALFIRIAVLEDEFTDIRTGGNYDAAWFGLGVGLVVWVGGLLLAQGTEGRTRFFRLALWFVMQVAVVVAAVIIAPGRPWS